MPPATAAFEDEKFGAYGFFLSSPKGRRAFPARSILRSPWHFASAVQQHATIDHRDWVSGYLDIPSYDADVAEFPGGTLVKGFDISDDDLEAALATRVEDIAYAHRQLGNQSFADALIPGFGAGCRKSSLRTAIVGRSFGGAAAAAAMLRLPSVRGGVNLVGSMFGSVVSAGLHRLFLLIGHDNKMQNADPSWKATWSNLTWWKIEFEVKEAAHHSFPDLPLVTEVLGLQGHLPQEVGQFLGDIEGSRMMNLTVSYLTKFLDFVLKNQSDGVLFHGKDFPEVILSAA